VVANDDEAQMKMAAKATRRFFAALPARRALQLGEANPSSGEFVIRTPQKITEQTKFLLRGKENSWLPSFPSVEQLHHKRLMMATENKSTPNAFGAAPTQTIVSRSVMVSFWRAKNGSQI